MVRLRDSPGAAVLALRIVDEGVEVLAVERMLVTRACGLADDHGGDEQVAGEAGIAHSQLLLHDDVRDRRRAQTADLFGQVHLVVADLVRACEDAPHRVARVRLLRVRDAVEFDARGAQLLLGKLPRHVADLLDLFW